jgi:tetratricopeptide (TPR) repeat protein
MLRQLFFLTACASAFLPSSVKLGAPTCLRAETEDDNLVVDDAARASLEKLALMTRSSEADERPRPKSSGTARRRRAEERKLVEVLGRTTEPEQFKAAIDGLWSLWFSERGSENKAKLEAVDRLISEGEASQWVEAAAEARKLMEEHPDWPEALNRLATVEYLRGEYDTSVELCKKVLAAKIHHFGALSGICMCYQKLGDEEALAEWRERMLPNDPSARRRWADRAIRALDRLDG